MKNRYLMIKLYEFHAFYVRNKGVYGAFGLYPSRVLGRFLIHNISPGVIRYFSSFLAKRNLLSPIRGSASLGSASLGI